MDPLLKTRAIELRQRGFSYPEIQESLGTVPKGTLSYWFKDLELSKEATLRLANNRSTKLAVSRVRALEVNAIKHADYLTRLRESNLPLRKRLVNLGTSKIALAMLYLGEGSKNPQRSALVFGNSDPEVISLFLQLFRRCYSIDESKFRCTVQCRADQDVAKLKHYWTKITGIPARQFYKAQIDSRTAGKPSKKLAYMGVCRLDYLSAEIFHDLLQTINVLKGR